MVQIGDDKQTNFGDDYTGRGIEASHIRYQQENFQYKNSGEEWTDFPADAQLTFYYCGETDLADQATISVVDWWNNSDPKTVTYKVLDAVTRKEFEGTEYTTHYHGNHPGTTIWVTPDEAGVYEVYAVTIDDQLTEGKGNDVYDANGIRVSLENKNAATVYIYVKAKPTKDALTVEYWDADSSEKIGTDSSLQVEKGYTFTDAILENSKVKDGATYKDFYGTVAAIPTGLPKDQTIKMYEEKHCRAEISEDGKTLKLYFQKKVYGVQYSWTGLDDATGLVNEDGETVTVTKPEGDDTLHQGVTYTVEVLGDQEQIWCCTRMTSTAIILRSIPSAAGRLTGRLLQASR